MSKSFPLTAAPLKTEAVIIAFEYPEHRRTKFTIAFSLIRPHGHIADTITNRTLVVVFFVVVVFFLLHSLRRVSRDSTHQLPRHKSSEMY